MPRRGLKANTILNHMVRFHHDCESGVHNRYKTVPHHLGLIFFLCVFPELPLRAVEQILGVGEGRNPLAVVQPRIPADVVHVHMRTEDVIDLRGVHASGSEPVEIVRTHMVPQGNVAGAVVADAGIDEDSVVRGAHYEGVNTEPELQILSTEMRHQPVPMRLKVLVSEVGK